MKERWSISDNKLAAVEEGLHQEKREYINRLEYKINYCTRCIPYLRLIFLLEVMLFFGWGCYMILQTYRVTENEATNITPVRYPPIFESLSEIQKSRPSTEVPMIFVKPGVIIDKLNNLLEDMELTKQQNLMQDKTIVTNLANMVQTNMQNNNNMRSNSIVEISDASSLSGPSSGNLLQDEKFMKNPVRQKFSSIEYIDKNTRSDKSEEPLNKQLLEKIRKTLIILATGDSEEFESKNDFTVDANRLTLESQENHALDVSNILDVTTISNLENSMDRTIADPMNILQDIRQQSSDLSKDATQDDHSEHSSSSIVIDERVNTRSEPDFVICPSYESHESSDVSLKDSAKDSSISQPVLVQEITEQIKNRSSDDIDARNENKHDINDGEMSMSTSPDTSASQDHFAFDISMATVQNTEEQHSSESIANIKEDEKYESAENKDLNKFLLPTVQSSVELTTTNVDKFQWFNVPARFADSLVRKDISKESEMRSSLFNDTYEKTDFIDDFIPGSQCEITIEKNILKVTCPAIKFDEQWNFTSSEIHTVDVPEVTNSGGIIDDNYTDCDEDASEQLGVDIISNENSDKEVTTPQDSTRSKTAQITDTVELQESTSTAKISNDALPGLSEVTYIDPFDNGGSQEYTNYDYLNEGEIEQAVTTVPSSISESDSSTIDFNKRLISETFDIQQSEQLQKSEENDYFRTLLQDIEDLYALEKKLTSPFILEIFNILTQQHLPKSSENDYRDIICHDFPDMCFTSQRSWREQHIALKKILEHVKSHDFPYYYIRKKRMIDDLTWQQEHVSNTLEEDDKNADLSETLRKIFQKMEILAACVDRLHERYLLHNKLDDDYVSSEFPMETEERRELYTPRIVYEK